MKWLTAAATSRKSPGVWAPRPRARPRRTSAARAAGAPPPAHRAARRRRRSRRPRRRCRRGRAPRGRAGRATGAHPAPGALLDDLAAGIDEQPGLLELLLDPRVARAQPDVVEPADIAGRVELGEVDPLADLAEHVDELRELRCELLVDLTDRLARAERARQPGIGGLPQTDVVIDVDQRAGQRFGEEPGDVERGIADFLERADAEPGAIRSGGQLDPEGLITEPLGREVYEQSHQVPARLLRGIEVDSRERVGYDLVEEFVH